MSTRETTWKPVPFLEGCYEVSDEGLIRRVACGSGTQPGRPVKIHSDRRGYRYFSASVRREVHHVSIHRAVAWAFIGAPPTGKTEVNHKDGDKANNSVSNLEWCSRAENCQHAYRTGLRRDERPVEQRTADGTLVATFKSLSEASRTTGVNINCIVDVCRGRRSLTHGCRWNYKEGPTHGQ